MRLRVLVVSDVRVVQEGLSTVLARQDSIDVVSSVDTLQAAVQGARLQPDVLLLDAARLNSVEQVRDLVAAVRGCKVVAFGVRDTDEEIFTLAAAGTAGYVHACAASEDVVRVLERVMRDELPCSARAAASLYRRVAALSQDSGERGSADAAHGPVSLSPRELEIAHLIDDGLSNKQIGRQLGIEPATVKNHVHNLCEKLNVHRRGEAVARIRALLRTRAAPRLRARRPDPASPGASALEAS
jgi:two-component system, NarL family, nitrate/nitrite response regulator NarL